MDYDAARTAATPEETVLEFLNETYGAAARAAGWDRYDLDRADMITKLTQSAGEQR